MILLDINFIDVMQRISEVIEIKDGTKPYDKNIASELGLSQSQYANYKKRNKIPYPEISEFCYRHQITINWILYGISGMNLIQNEEEVYKARALKRINGSAGAGAYNEDDIESSFVNIDKKSANLLGIYNTKKIDIIRVVGDSMSPTIEDNTLIMLDRNDTSYVPSEVFAVNTIEGLLIKRLMLNSNGNIDLISDNKIYNVITMPMDEVYIVGKVVGYLEGKAA